MYICTYLDNYLMLLWCILHYLIVKGMDNMKGLYILIFISSYNQINIGGHNNMTRKKASFNLDTKLLKELKLTAVKLDKTQTKLVEKYIKQGLESENV